VFQLSVLEESEERYRLINQEAEVYRDLIKHENQLRDHRTNWFLTAQGFVFGASTYSVSEDQFLWLMACALIGLTLTIVLSKGIIVTSIAVVKLMNEWNHRNQGYDGPPIIGLLLGKTCRENIWFNQEFVLPSVFVVVWYVTLTSAGFKINDDPNITGYIILTLPIALYVVVRFFSLSEKFFSWMDKLETQGVKRRLPLDTASHSEPTNHLETIPTEPAESEYHASDSVPYRSS